MYHYPLNVYHSQPQQQSMDSKSPIHNKDGKKISWGTIILISLVLLVVGLLVYFTLPSTKPVDLGVQRIEMQKANFCEGRCCTGDGKPPVGKQNSVQSAVNLMELVGNANCVECPDKQGFQMSECSETDNT